MNGNFSRREFLSVAAVAVAARSTPAVSRTLLPAAAGDINLPTTRIRKAYPAKPVPAWPKPNLDVAAESCWKDTREVCTGLFSTATGSELFVTSPD